MLTVGEKIKYFRKRLGLTQDQLAEITGIHPVSIRKYETNKMQPQAAQIERIAEALHVNRSAIDGFMSLPRLDTVGDLAGLLIEWHKSGILMIQGERNNDKQITADTAKLVPSSLFCDWFQIEVLSNKKKKVIVLDDFLIKLADQSLLNDLLRWERLYCVYVNASKFIENADQETLNNYFELESSLEAIELEMLSNQTRLKKV